MPQTSEKLIFKNSLLLSLRSFLVMLVGLYTSRVLLAKLGIEDYGTYNIVGSVVVLFGSVRAMFTNAIQRYLNYTKNGGEYNQVQVFNASLLLQLILAGAFLILTETLGIYALHNLNLTPEQHRDAQIIYQIAVATALVSIITVPYDALIIAHEKMDIFAWLSVLSSLLNLGIVYLLSLGPFSRLVNYAILVFLASCIIRGITAAYCHRRFKESRIQKTYSKPLLKEMTAFAGWNFLGYAGYSIMHQGVNYLLNLAGGVVVNAARAIAYTITSKANELVLNANTAFKPQTNAAAAEQDPSNFHKLLGYNAKASYSVFLLIMVPVLIFAQPFIQLWLGQVPEYVIVFLLAISPYYLLRTLHELVNQFFVSIGQMKWYSIIELATMILILPLSWALLKGGRPFWTVFLCMFVLEAVNHAGSVWLGARKYSFPFKRYAKDVYLPFLLVSSLSALLVIAAYRFGLAQLELWGRIILCGLGIECILATAMAFIVLSKQERHAILGHISLWIKREK